MVKLVGFSVLDFFPFLVFVFVYTEIPLHGRSKQAFTFSVL
jgi:hypothetical protein